LKILNPKSKANKIKKYAEEKVRLNKIGKPQNDEFDLLIGVTAIENKNNCFFIPYKFVSNFGMQTQPKVKVE
jgi:hypothetical protein